MSSLVSKQDWIRKLRQSGAVEWLLAGKPDLFPLADVQRITDRLLKPKASTLGSREKCSLFLKTELRDVSYEFTTYALIILACLHVVPSPVSRREIYGLLWRSRLDMFDPGALPGDRFSLYLQCIMIAKKVSDDIFTDDEVAAACHLFDVTQKKAGPPGIWKALQLVDNLKHNLYLPPSLFRGVLTGDVFQEVIIKDLEFHRQRRDWSAAYQLAKPLEDVVGLPQAVAILQDHFPDWAMWAAWRPSAHRVAIWNQWMGDDNRRKILSILDLEGPDTSGQQCKTLRESSLYIFDNRRTDQSGTLNADRLLNLLDKFIPHGSEGLEIFIYLCHDSSKLTPQTLDTLYIILALHNSTSVESLAEFVRAESDDTTVYNRMAAYANALPIIQSSPELQTTFGLGLEIRGPMALYRAQKHLYRLSQDNMPRKEYNVQVQRLQSALFESPWLHEHWKPEYINVLKEKDATQIKDKFMHDLLQDTHTTSLEWYTDLLAGGLGHILQRNFVSTIDVIKAALEALLWSHEDGHDDRVLLRTKLVSVAGTDESLTALCLEQSYAETAEFVRGVNSILVTDTDQMCVDMASFLAWRHKSPRGVNDCWKSLLLHLVRRRPPGLLNRATGQILPTRALRDFSQNLFALYGRQCHDPHWPFDFSEKESMPGKWYKRVLEFGAVIGRSNKTGSLADNKTEHKSSCMSAVSMALVSDDEKSSI